MTGPETPSPEQASPPRAITPEKRVDALRQLNRRSPLAFFWDWLRVTLVAMVAFLLIRAFIVEAFKIPSGSMEHTLLVGDFLLVNKLVYGAEVPFTGRRLPRLRTPER